MIEKIKEKNDTPISVGLDPKIDYIPNDIKNIISKKYGFGPKFAAKCLYEFNKGIIDAIYDIVPIVKIQSAYYELYGSEGIFTFADTINYAKMKGLYVIVDVKRNDIEETSEAYANAYLGKTNITYNSKFQAFGADSMTVNPYFGSDGIVPFINVCKKYSKSIFTIVKTSNKSSFEIQDLICEGVPLYEKIAHFVSEWGKDLIGKNNYSNIGAVIGATHPKVFKTLRKIMKKSYFLVPGCGAQGGSVKNISDAFNENGLGCIINASRSIICAHMKNNENYQNEARRETLKLSYDVKKLFS
jgi:orotidine-5'-phosphate decarboxylase